MAARRQPYTLPCRSSVITLYPPITGQMDRQRESVMRACLRKKANKT